MLKKILYIGLPLFGVVVLLTQGFLAVYYTFSQMKHALLVSLALFLALGTLAFSRLAVKRDRFLATWGMLILTSYGLVLYLYSTEESAFVLPAVLFSLLSAGLMLVMSIVRARSPIIPTICVALIFSGLGLYITSPNLQQGSLIEYLFLWLLLCFVSTLHTFFSDRRSVMRKNIGEIVGGVG